MRADFPRDLREQTIIRQTFLSQICSREAERETLCFFLPEMRGGMRSSFSLNIYIDACIEREKDREIEREQREIGRERERAERGREREREGGGAEEFILFLPSFMISTTTPVSVIVVVVVVVVVVIAAAEEIVVEAEVLAVLYAVIYGSRSRSSSRSRTILVVV